jgi:hypothetical protein
MSALPLKADRFCAILASDKHGYRNQSRTHGSYLLASFDSK